MHDFCMIMASGAVANYIAKLLPNVAPHKLKRFFGTRPDNIYHTFHCNSKTCDFVCRKTAWKWDKMSKSFGSLKILKCGMRRSIEGVLDVVLRLWLVASACPGQRTWHLPLQNHSQLPFINRKKGKPLGHLIIVLTSNQRALCWIILNHRRQGQHHLWIIDPPENGLGSKSKA